MAPYRPSGSRSHRSGRNQAEQEVFEGLPVKQWTPQYTRQSLVPPAPETETHDPDDKWNREPPMPRDAHMLQPWTYELLRLARSGKIGRKRKPIELDDDGEQGDNHEAAEGEGAGSGGAVGGSEDRGGAEDKSFSVKKWRLVSDHALVPEHKHLEFLAKRRKGLPSLYGGGEVSSNTAVSMRKTRVQRNDPITGDVVLYEVLVPEGSSIDGEIIAGMDSGIDSKPNVSVAPGTVVEGLGVANDEGMLVAEHLRPSVAPRRNRPPPKKKGGPGRGKKRVTFTNPDGTTYTTIVPNATKIIPQPGQTVKHVAKGEEAVADVSAAQAAAAATAQTSNEGHGEDEGGDDDGSDDEEGDDDDDDREEGEVSDNDAPQTANGTPATSTPARTDSSNGMKKEKEEDVKPPPTSVPPVVEEMQQEVKSVEVEKDTEMSEDQPREKPSEQHSAAEEQKDEQKEEQKMSRSTSSSPEVSLAKVASASHSRQNSLTERPSEATVNITAEEAKVVSPPEEAPQEVNQEPATAEGEKEESAPEAAPEAATEAVPEVAPDAVPEPSPEAASEAAPEPDTKENQPSEIEDTAGESKVEAPPAEQEDVTSAEQQEPEKVEAAEPEEGQSAEPEKEGQTEPEKEEKTESPAKKVDSDGDVGMGEADASSEGKPAAQDGEKKEDEGDDLLGGLEADLQEQKKGDEA